MRTLLFFISTILSLSCVADALVISAPTHPLIVNDVLWINWTATSSDPLSFNLALVCIGNISALRPVDREVSTNVTGAVEYVMGCLG
jgi:hypothetical protein